MKIDINKMNIYRLLMDIKVLRSLIAVADTGSITDAAERLGVSQPTVSRQIKDLEEELGCRLIERSNYSVRLTEEGMLLRRRAEDIVGMVDSTVEEIKGSTGPVTGDIRIGCAESRGIGLLAECMRSLRVTNPGIRFHIYSGNWEDLSERLDSGFLDFVVAVRDVDATRYDSLEMPYRDRWGVVMKRDSPLAGRDSIRPEDLEGVPLIVSREAYGKENRAWLGSVFDRTDVVATVNLAFNGSILVEKGMGCMITLEGLVPADEGGGLCFRLLDPPLLSPMRLAWRRGRTPSAASELLLGCAAEAFRSRRDADVASS